jgi:deazaflavin-dependent oxidoreductase (nitroreductase family)
VRGWIAGCTGGRTAASRSPGRRCSRCAWPLNLKADPRVQVRLGADTADYRGRPAAAHEIERYWAALLEAWPAHATYRARSGVRHVFVLEPA